MKDKYLTHEKLNSQKNGILFVLITNLILRHHIHQTKNLNRKLKSSKEN